MDRILKVISCNYDKKFKVRINIDGKQNFLIFQCDKNTTVRELKEFVSNAYGLPLKRSHIFFCGTKMTDDIKVININKTFLKFVSFRVDTSYIA